VVVIITRVYKHVCSPLTQKNKLCTNKIKLENVTITMHCNLRPPDAEPVIFRFN